MKGLNGTFTGVNTGVIDNNGTEARSHSHRGCQPEQHLQPDALE